MLTEILGTEVLGKDGNVQVSEIAKNSIVCIYFSAHWCPPCRGFTPVLTEAYKGWKAAGKSVEVVFVSSDQGPSEFSSYWGEMPWLAVPHGDPRVAACKSKFGVSGIPMLVVLKGDGTVVVQNGRTDVANDPNCVDKWCSM